MMKMALFDWLVFFAVLFVLCRAIEVTSGDLHPIYKDCVKNCEKSGLCIKGQCYKNWNTTVKTQLTREEFRPLFSNQEVLYLALCTLNIGLIYSKWLSFIRLVHYKLPLRRRNGKIQYEYTSLWHIYAILSMNSWFWKAVFYVRNVDLIERLCCLSTLVFVGFDLIVAIIRTLSIRTNAARVMVAAPMMVFIATHFLYMNLVEFNRGWNLFVVMTMSTTKLFFWSAWGGISDDHPSRWKLWMVLVGSALGILVEASDFPPFMGLKDSQGLWQVIESSQSYLWWSFIRDDAVFTTSMLINKAR